MPVEEHSTPTGVTENVSQEMDNLFDASIRKQETENECYFTKIGDMVEKEDDNGVMEVESLCMNCHENVSCRASLLNRDMNSQMENTGYNEASPP